MSRSPFQGVLDFSFNDWFSHQSDKGIGVTHPMRVVRGRTEGDPSVRAAGDARAASELENPVWTSLLPGITLNEFAIHSSIYITASKSVSIPSDSFLVVFPD